MNPIPVTDAMLAEWQDDDRVASAERVLMLPPPGQEDHVEACHSIHVETDEGHVVLVPWRLDEIELARLAQGGVIWLSTLGGLPPHHLEVR